MSDCGPSRVVGKAFTHANLVDDYIVKQPELVLLEGGSGRGPTVTTLHSVESVLNTFRVVPDAID